MKTTAATRRPALEILRRPEGGLGETGPSVVSPSVSAKANRDVVATLHQVIDTLTELADAAPVTPASSPAQDLPLLLNAVEAGKLLSISRAKVLDLAARGQIPSLRIGGSVRIPRDLVIDWTNDHCSSPASVTRFPRPSRANWTGEA